MVPWARASRAVEMMSIQETMEAELPTTNKPLSWLPGLLIVAGLFFLISGIYSGGPEFMGGLVFGGVSLAAAAAILYRRARDERESNSDRD